MDGEGWSEVVPKIRVVIRKRPLGTRELTRKDQDIVRIEDGRRVIVHEIRCDAPHPETESI